MPYSEYNLPVAPLTRDMWDVLAEEGRPIVVYGMGNGADKLLDRFEKYNIKIADIFASDGFVRGHSFRGFKVKSFSEIKDRYSDFVIVLSFASNREDVLQMLEEINANYDMYIPDMPVASVMEYFDKEFYNDNYDAIISAYANMADEASKNAFCAVINYKLTGKMSYLLGAWSSKDELYSLFGDFKIENIIDAGAYNGDTLREVKKYFKCLKTAFALEPDDRNFRKLAKYSEAESEINLKIINAAAWSESCNGIFSGSGNRNSSISSTASFEHKKAKVDLVRLDDISSEKIDYIKYDVEGSEYEALVGSDRIISEYKPVMLVSLYHRSRDIFYLVNHLHERYPFYKMYLRRLKCVPAWELDLILIDEGKIK